jgi:phosphoserine phosphatase
MYFLSHQMFEQPNFVITVLSTNKTSENQALVQDILDAIEHNGAFIKNVEQLSSKTSDIFATDITFQNIGVAQGRELLTYFQREYHLPFDFAVQEAENRRKKLLISDMDSTIIDQECLDEIAGFAGLKAEVSAITERAMNGELDFKLALRERVGLLTDMSESVLEQVFAEKITFMEGAYELVQTMRANGAKCVLVSGGFTFFTSRVAERIGFHMDEANVLLAENGKLTGKVKEPILDSTSKLNALKFYAEEQNLGLSQTLAVGDGANDLPMILEAGLGVAYMAKPKVKEAAPYKVDIPNLKTLLYIQGYKEQEIITAK